MLRFVRAILAILIACSVGMAPVRAGFAGAPGFATASDVASAHATGKTGAVAHRHDSAVTHAHDPAHAMPPSAHEPSGGCCDEARDANGVPASQPAAGDCGAMPGCVLKCFGVVPWSPMLLSVPSTGSSRVAFRVTDLGPPAPAARPFHPPRS